MTAPEEHPSEQWWRDGESFLGDTVGALSDADLAADSPLPGWGRARVVAHVARNADALVNLLTWARTGVETPMYTSTEQRDADIADTAALAPAALRADLTEARASLAVAVGGMAPADWEAQVRTAQGRTVPAREVLWMRCREVWVHAVDLGADPAGWPRELAAALITDVLAVLERKQQTPDLTLEAGGRTWGTGSVVITGEETQLAAWLTGRGPAPVEGAPELPPWL